jgi:hypothetical protein
LDISGKRVYSLVPMTSKPPTSRIEFRRGPSLLLGPSSIRTHVIDTLFHIGHTRDDAAALWTAATTDPGAHGDRARQLIGRATEIQIIVDFP